MNSVKWQVQAVRKLKLFLWEWAVSYHKRKKINVCKVAFTCTLSIIKNDKDKSLVKKNSNSKYIVQQSVGNVCSWNKVNEIWM